MVRGSNLVLDNLSFTLLQGQHTAILGPNGCGKSTLLKLLTRELYPYGGQGTMRVMGSDRWVIGDLRTLIGVISEEPKGELLGHPTGLQVAVSGLLGTYGVTSQYKITNDMWDRAAQALNRVNASRLAEQPVETMSTGERRRVWIARALVSEPKALVLDEPTTGLDMNAAHHFMSIVEDLAQSGVTIVVVTHHLEEIVPAIQRVILMSQGAIVADGPRDAILQVPALQALFEIENETLLRNLELKLRSQ